VLVCAPGRFSKEYDNHGIERGNVFALVLQIVDGILFATCEICAEVILYMVGWIFNTAWGREPCPLGYDCHGGNLAIVICLKKIGYVNVHAAVNNNGWTPLHEACLMGNFWIVEYLVESCRVNLEAETKHGGRAIPFASYRDPMAPRKPAKQSWTLHRTMAISRLFGTSSNMGSVSRLSVAIE
jgi:Ankyrin repeats (3 copies)